MMTIKKQELQSLDPKDYKIRVLLSGSNKCNSKEEFHDDVCSIINRFKEDILFISTNTSKGPEKWIVEWCIKNNYPCLIVNDETEDFLNLTSAANQSSKAVLFITSTINKRCEYITTLARERKLNIIKILVN